MKPTLILLFCSISLNLVAQSKINCDELLSKDINIELNHLENFKKNFANFEYCGLDATDVEIFSNTALLGSILIALVPENTTDMLTFGALLNKLLEFKSSAEYPKVREFTLISKELSNKIARIENWNADKIKLAKLEISDIDLEKMFDFIKFNPNSKTYKEIFILLNEEKKRDKQTNLTKAEEYSDIFTNYGNADLIDLVNKANSLSRPLLIYFTGYGCVNSRKIERSILSEDVIYKKLKNQFYFVSLYLDDKTLLSDADQFKSSSTGALIKTIGQKHCNLQIEKFSVSMQPYFAILDSKGNIVATESYLNDPIKFMSFLDKALSENER